MVSTPRGARAAKNAAPLIVWANGQRVGAWEVRDGEHRFGYDEAWLASPAARRLSLSLPFTPGNAAHRGDVVRNYFDNLLPDNDNIRRRLQQKFGTRSTATFDLLGAIGRDCVGAVQLLPQGASPIGFDRIDALPLDDAGVERAIDASLSAGPVLGQRNDHADFRISIAGAQEKTALLQRDGRWYLPRNATPTTHILKLPLGLIGNIQADMHESVENEWLCSRIMSAFGLPMAHCEIAVFGARKVLVVQRFDRALQHAGTAREWIARLPQEDFCQALGLPPEQKYEADGGPGMRGILRVLDGSSDAAADKLAFVKAQMVFWLLCAIDGHAKNFSIFLERGGGFRLTPFYDVLSAWPIMGRGPRQIAWQKARMAMAVHGRSAHWKLADILPRHWDAVARLAGLGDARELRSEIIQSVPEVVSKIKAQLPDAFAPHVARTILEGLQNNARRLALATETP